MDKTTDSQSWDPWLESAGSGSSALDQGTVSSLPSPLVKDLKPLVPWLLAYKQRAFFVARWNYYATMPFQNLLYVTHYTIETSLPDKPPVQL